MRFTVDQEIFNQLPNVCIGVVVAKNIDNGKKYQEIDELLDENIQKAMNYFSGKKVKEEQAILPYREAFRSLNINPNKYPCSIEALFTRISKGKAMPYINPIVDLGNAISLKYTLPMGAHDITHEKSDIVIRLSKKGDTFLPFGSTQEEVLDEGEAIYAVENQVRTRRWTWRQSENGKITENSKDIFFPIDGFVDINKEQVLLAQEELSKYLKEIFNCDIITGFVDINNQSIEL